MATQFPLPAHDLAESARRNGDAVGAVAVAAVTPAQVAFTYAPWMQALPGAVPLADGVLIVAAGVALMAILEIEKALLRHLGWFADDGPGPERRGIDATSRVEP